MDTVTRGAILRNCYGMPGTAQSLVPQVGLEMENATQLATSAGSFTMLGTALRAK